MQKWEDRMKWFGEDEETEKKMVAQDQSDEDWMGSVSYTHLDVYKRQRQCVVSVKIPGNQGHCKAGILAGTSQMVPYMQISLLQRAGVYERAREAWGIKEGDQ